MNAVFKLNLSPSEKVVALAMADHAHDDGTQARMGLASLSKKSSLSKRQVQRVIKSLIDKNVIFLAKESTPTQPGWYTFVMSPVDILTTGYRHTGSKGVTPVTAPVDTGVTQISKNRSIEKDGVDEIFDQSQRLGGLLAKTNLNRRVV
jgi:predicted transcriptional regulator